MKEHSAYVTLHSADHPTTFSIIFLQAQLKNWSLFMAQVSKTQETKKSNFERIFAGTFDISTKVHKTFLLLHATSLCFWVCEEVKIISREIKSLNFNDDDYANENRNNGTDENEQVLRAATTTARTRRGIRYSWIIVLNN